MPCGARSEKYPYLAGSFSKPRRKDFSFYDGGKLAAPHIISVVRAGGALSNGNLYALRALTPKPMKKQFILGLTGGILGLGTALFVIGTATSSDVTLSGVQAALFSSLGLMGAAIARKETRFAGWMLISSAIWITLSVPIAGTFNLLYLYMPTIIILGIAAVLCFREPEPEEEETEEY
jgi:hypothetical protein